MTSSTPVSSIVLSRYANALLDLAEQSGVVEKIQNDFMNIAALLDESRELCTVVSSPLLHKSKQVTVVETMCAHIKAHVLMVNFLNVLVENRRLSALRGVMIAYEAAVAERKGIKPVQVTSAVDLTDKQKKELQVRLVKSLGHEVTLSCAIDPSIMGGLVITVGSYMIDDSVRRKIDILNNVLMKGSNNNAIQNLKEVV